HKKRPTTLVLFLSSRRRHTRSKRDWSSDVCSSDLGLSQRWLANPLHRGTVLGQSPLQSFRAFSPSLLSAKIIQRYGQWATLANRSEERRVGKEDHVRAVTVE